MKTIRMISVGALIITLSVASFVLICGELHDEVNPLWYIPMKAVGLVSLYGAVKAGQYAGGLFPFSKWIEEILN